MGECAKLENPTSVSNDLFYNWHYQQITMYYEVSKDVINIVTLFDTRQHPDKIISIIKTAPVK